MSNARKTGSTSIVESINEFLDKYILPWPVRYLTFRLVILMTIGLLIPLIMFGNNTVLVLMANSYLNVMSVAVSSIVLLYSTISEAHQKQIAEIQEKRAREDHLHVTAMHSLVLQSVENQRAEIDDLKRLLSQLTNQPYEPLDLSKKQDLQSLHPRGKRRFHSDELVDRWKSNYHDNSMINALNKDFPADSE
ncbi:MAG TPA: hypothetical protein VF338_12225 [Leptolinea sp.]